MKQLQLSGVQEGANAEQTFSVQANKLGFNQVKFIFLLRGEADLRTKNK